MQISRNSLTLLVGAAASALILSACGGGSSASPPALTQQTITFSAPTTATVGDTASLSATSSSGLTAFTFASSTPTICTVSGNTVTFVSGGSACSLTASQAGNSTYASATSAARTVTPPAKLAFSTGFGPNNLTVEGGKFASDGGSNLLDWTCRDADRASYKCNAGSNGLTDTVSAENSDYYFYYQTPTAPTDLYSQIEVYAPGVTAMSTSADTGGLQINGQTKLTFNFGQNPEWVTSGTTNFYVNLTLGKRILVNSNPCNIVVRAIVASSMIASQANDGVKNAYSVPLSDFWVVQNCGIGTLTPSSTATALTSAVGGPVSRVTIGGGGGSAAASVNGGDTAAHISGANLTVTGQYSTYPTTVSMKGGITFK